MKQQDGIALIATLLIMAAIVTLGVGSLFLTNMNLRIAENSRTHAIARYNAEAGLEAAFVKLKQDYKAATPNQFPASLVLPTSPDATVTYRAINAGSTYQPYTSGLLRTQARVVIVGVGPNNARYQAEALLGASTSASTTPPIPVGLTSENVVNVNGGPTLLDAQLHGNAGFDIAGGVAVKKCNASNSSCTDLSVADMPVTAAPGQASYTCKASGGSSSGLCSGGKPVHYTPAPISLGNISQQYADLRNGTSASPSKFGLKITDIPLTFPPSGCTTVASLATTYTSGKICVNGDATIPANANYSNVTLIVKGKVTVSSTATFNTANLLSMGDMSLGGDVVMNDSRLFSDTKVDLSGSIEYTGFGTVASGGDMNWTSKAKGIYNAASNDVGLALMSVGNFDGQGGLKGRGGSDWVNAAILAGGTASTNGGARVRGGIASKGELTIKGNNEVDGKAVFTNSDIFKQDMDVTALSRR